MHTQAHTHTDTHHIHTHTHTYKRTQLHTHTRTFVRRSEEDHRLTLLSGSVGAQVADEADLRPELPWAVWTGNVGGCWAPVGAVLPGLSPLFSCGSPPCLTGLGSPLDSCSPEVPVHSFLLPGLVADAESLQGSL